jgi:hypothetical protein
LHLCLRGRKEGRKKGEKRRRKKKQPAKESETPIHMVARCQLNALLHFLFTQQRIRTPSKKAFKEAQFVLAAVNPVQQQYKQLAAFNIHP